MRDANRQSSAVIAPTLPVDTASGNEKPAWRPPKELDLQRQSAGVHGEEAVRAPACTGSLPAEAESAGKARRLVSAALHTWHLASLDASAVLIASELVANTVEHTRCRSVGVTVARIAEATVRVAVADTDRTEPRARAAEPEDERGRGLALVAAFADRWGVDQTFDGKRVWAELEEPP